MIETGIGAALITESGIRNALSDIRLTHQAKEYLSKQAQKGKEEVTRVLVREVKRFLNEVHLHEELQKALAGLSLEIEAKIKIVPSKDGNGNQVKYLAKARRGK